MTLDVIMYLVFRISQFILSSCVSCLMFILVPCVLCFVSCVSCLMSYLLSHTSCHSHVSTFLCLIYSVSCLTLVTCSFGLSCILCLVVSCLTFVPCVSCLVSHDVFSIYTASRISSCHSCFTSYNHFVLVTWHVVSCFAGLQLASLIQENKSSDHY